MEKFINYKFAGILALISIPLSIVIFFLSLSQKYLFFATLISVLYMPFSIYIYLALKQLLNIEYNFRYANSLIYLLILTTIILAIALLLQPLFGFFVYVPFGIITFLFGRKIEKVQNDMFGYKGKFIMTAKISGILLATLIFSIIGFLVNLINTYYLASIFLATSNKIQSINLKQY